MNIFKEAKQKELKGMGYRARRFKIIWKNKKVSWNWLALADAPMANLIKTTVRAIVGALTHGPWPLDLAARYPELRILMVHMGGASFSDLSFAAIETATKYKNITMIGSAVRTGAILKAIRTLGADRICFGSDTPFESMQVEIARYNAMLQDEVTPEEKERIMGGNILSVLGMKT